MKSALTEGSSKEERESPVEDFWVQDEMTHDDFSAILWESMLEKVSSPLSENQRKWVKAYYLYGSTPSEIAIEEGVSAAAVKEWRRDPIGKLKKYFITEGLR